MTFYELVPIADKYTLQALSPPCSAYWLHDMALTCKVASWNTGEVMFRGVLITKGEAGYKAELQTIDESVLPPGDVLVQVEWSTLN